MDTSHCAIQDRADCGCYQIILTLGLDSLGSNAQVGDG